MTLVNTARVAAFTALLMAGAAACQGLEAQARRGQGPGGPRMMGAAELALSNAEALGLSEEQAAALEAIRSEADEATSELRTSMRERMQAARASGDRSAMRQLMEEARKALEPFDARAAEVLTAEQRERLEELRPRRRRGPPGS